MLLDLDDPAALDPAVSGGKAARLAQARRSGLPVLPGIVVPVRVSSATHRAGVMALADGGNSGAARLAVLRAPVEPGLLDGLRDRVSGLGRPLVVRSSSPLEDLPAWSGAFSSFLDIGDDDLGTALRGCWASAFAVDPLERASASGVAPDRLGMAVLVQPQVRPDAGGLARIAADGAIGISAVKGSPAPLMAGWERGVEVEVGPDGSITGDGAGVVPHAVARAVADVAARVRDAMGCDVIEWAVEAARVTLLQCRAGPRAITSATPATDGLDHPVALRLARLALRHRGPLAERLVLSWACASNSPPPAVDAAVGQGPPAQLLRAAEQQARDLASQAWALPPDEAMAAAQRTLRDVRGPEPLPALQRLAGLHAVAPDDAAEALSLSAAAAATAVGPARSAPDAWEPFAFAAVRANGVRVGGQRAADGIGAGVLTTVTNPHSVQIDVHRPVLTARWPLPGLAPLMWGAAGLVTGAGSPAAHLLEVAHSLRVPAVVGCDLDAWTGGGRLAIAAVDGNAGAVYLTTG